MMDLQTTEPERRSVSLAAYVAGLANSGKRIVPGALGTFWVQYETRAMMRLPTFDVSPPLSSEILNVLWSQGAAVASYVVEPHAHHPANAFLYLCTDQKYSLKKLSSPMRRNVRRGLRELKISSVSYDELMAHGAQAFYDSFRRMRLNGGEAKDLERYFSPRAKSPGHCYLGAWKGGQLAAFLPITEVEDWVEFDSCFSMDACLPLRPNDALMFYALLHYLTERRRRVVSFGLSSIQQQSNKDGLHAFKTKVGFDARPIHRAFVPHPLLRPFANRLTLWSLNAALRFMPRERHLKKAGGVLACILGGVRTGVPEEPEQ